MVQFINPATGAVDGEAAFSAFIAGGVQIDWTSYPSAAFLLDFEVRGGTFLDNVRVDQFLLSVAENVEQQIDVGFKPDQVEFYTTGGGITGVPSATCNISSGVVDRQTADGIVQFCNSLSVNDNNNPAAAFGRFHNNRCAIVPSGSGISRSGELTSWLETPGDAVDGFGITLRDGGTGFDAFYAAFTFTALGHDLILSQVPASPGLESVSGFGFKPGSAYSVGSQVSNLNLSQGLRSTLYWATWDSIAQVAANRADRDGASPTDTRSVVEDAAVYVVDDTGIRMEADLSSFDADGVTLDWITVFSGSRYATAYVEEGPPIPPVGGGVPSAVKRRLREDD